MSRLYHLAASGALLLALASATATAAAQVTDPIAATTDPEDRAVMAEVAAAISSREPNIVQLDAALTKLPRATPLRGVVQAMRAAALSSTDNLAPAIMAIEEALRLLPDDPRPKIIAAGLFTFSGSPQRGADLWLRASEEAPEIARQIDRYTIMALVGRLSDIGDRKRADRVSARLGEIGFSAGLAPERSEAAVAAVREAVRSGRNDAALAGVPAIAAPGDLFLLYVDRRYQDLWSRVAEWAGVDLSAQALRYIEELRRDFTAADSFTAAVPYARRLLRYKAYDAVIGLFLPMFDNLSKVGDLEDAEFLAPIVASALSKQERGAEARALLTKVAAAAPKDNGGSLLNIDAAFVSLAAKDNDWPQVIARSNDFLAEAKAFGSFINRSAILQVEALRACALFQAGSVEAERASAEVLLEQARTPSPALDVYLCRRDTAAARALMLSRLADEGTRGWALALVQPSRDDANTPYAREIAALWQLVRTAPEVVTAAQKVGRILPHPLDQEIPAGFDPFRLKPRAEPPNPDAI